MLLFNALTYKRKFFLRRKIAVSGHVLWLSDYHSITANLNFLYTHSLRKFTIYDFGKQNHSIIDFYDLVLPFTFSDAINESKQCTYLNTIYNHVLNSSGNEIICLFQPSFAPISWLKKLLILGKHKKVNIIIIKVIDGYENDLDSYKNLLNPYIDFLLIFHIDEPMYVIINLELTYMNYRAFKGLAPLSFYIIDCKNMYNVKACTFIKDEFTF